MNRDQYLRRTIRLLTALFMAGLIVSGVTAIPLTSEVDFLAKITHAQEFVQQPASVSSPVWAIWLIKVQTAPHDVALTKPFLFYGTDWLAFGHFIIALAFIGAIRNPLRNAWLFTFGIIACLLVIPYALVCGAIRGIPIWWRFIDCSFGVLGIIPLVLCRKWVRELSQNPLNLSSAVL